MLRSILRSCSWSLTLDLVAVSDGGLQITLAPSSPNITVSSNSIKNLGRYPGYIDTCYRAAFTRFSALEQQLAADLAGT